MTYRLNPHETGMIQQETKTVPYKTIKQKSSLHEAPKSSFYNIESRSTLKLCNFAGSYSPHICFQANPFWNNIFDLINN